MPHPRWNAQIAPAYATMGGMSERTEAPQNAFIGVIAVWVLALLTAVAIAIFVPELDRAPWLVLGFAGVVLVSFVVQLAYGAVVGFIFRVAASAVGGLIVMGVISAGFGLAALIPD